MDPLLLILRIVHVGAAMLWFGGAIIGGFFLQPTAAALGPTGQSFMEHLLKHRRMGIFFPIVATLTIFAGAALYWRDSGGLQGSWISTPSGLAFTIGGLSAIVAYVGGFVLIGPSIATQAAVNAELARGDGVPTPDQRERLARADLRMRLANRIDLPLLIVAALTMAVGRYV